MMFFQLHSKYPNDYLNRTKYVIQRLQNQCCKELVDSKNLQMSLLLDNMTDRIVKRENKNAFVYLELKEGQHRLQKKSTAVSRDYTRNNFEILVTSLGRSYSRQFNELTGISSVVTSNSLIVITRYLLIIITRYSLISEYRFKIRPLMYSANINQLRPS